MAALLLLLATDHLSASEEPVPPGLAVRRLQAAVTIDGDLSDEGWKGAPPVRVDRLRATYTLNARCFLRLIGQYVGTRRDPTLYREEVEAKSGTFSGSALFAYRVNWQTVLFFGYGDDRTLVEDTNRLERYDRQFFLKLSYAWQR